MASPAKKPPIGGKRKRVISPIERDDVVSIETGPFPKEVSAYGGTGVNRQTEFHIDHLRSQFRDLARPNQFKIKIQTPEVLLGTWDPQILVLAKSTSFPSVEIQSFEFERSGLVLNLPTNKMNYGDLSISFYCDVDYKLRTFFHEWQRRAVYNWQSKVGGVPLLALDGALSVYQFDGNHNMVYGIQVDNVWPKSVSEISLDHESTDQAETFSVQFAFTNMEMLKDYSI